ncbi:coiled-coil domain-containing protein 12 [Plakobranchus ocellatus]|uniref:Coiled-coil domain-containing protein 12 n=1 Tax=Plakobranchus ocellatus TaxID=259542 RepID=A0AAV4BLU6_9GAST|nr:coiled-coil domain-containing protein 12 [Plakobranchus ocellatus]
MAAVGTLNDEALKRKERLKAMRDKHSSNKNDDESAMETEEIKEKLPKPSFRSYKPGSETLKDLSMDTIKPSDVTDIIKDQLEAGRTDHVVSEVDLNNLAPRKPDWDLKRDVSKKLEKLEKRTQRAIAELIRERLKASQNDLAFVVMSEGAGKEMDDDD